MAICRDLLSGSLCCCPTSLPTAKASTMLLYDGPGWLLPVLQQRQVSNVYIICPNPASDCLIVLQHAASNNSAVQPPRVNKDWAWQPLLCMFECCDSSTSCREHHQDTCVPDCMSACILSLCWRAAVWQRRRYKQQDRCQSGQQRITQEQSQVWGRHLHLHAAL